VVNTDLDAPQMNTMITLDQCQEILF